MAVIKEYEQQFGVREYGGGRRAGGEDFGFAQGISDLARGISAGADAMQRYEANKELSDAQVKVVEAQGTLQEDMRMLQETAQPGVSTAIQAKARTSELFKKMQDNYKTPAAKQYIALHGAKMTNSAVNISTAFDIDLSVKDKFAKQDVIFKNVRDKVFANPASFNEAIEPVLNEIENSVGVWDVPGGERTKIAMRARVEKELESMAWAAGIGAIQNPTMRKALVNAGRSAVTATADSGTIANAIYGQESSSGKDDTTKVNSQNVTGPMQVKQETFEGMKKLGVIPQDYDWKNPEQNKDAGFRWVAHLSKKYDGDAAKVAAAYYAGEGAVNSDGSINRDWKNKQRPQDPTVGEYVDSIVGRVENMGGLVEDNASAVSAIKDMPPWFDKLSPTKKVELFTRARTLDKQANAVANAAVKKMESDQKTEFSTFGRITSPEIRPESFSNPVDYREYKNMYDAAQLTEKVVNMPPAAQKAYLEYSLPKPENFPDPGAYSNAVSVYRNMAEHVQRANKEYSEDQMKTAYQRKFHPEGEIQPIVDFSAQNLIDQIAIRGPQAEAVASYQGKKLKLMMNEEAIGVANQMYQMSAKDQTEYIKQITNGVGNKDYVRTLFGHAFPNDAAVQSAVSILTSSNASPEKRADDVADIMRGRQLLMPVKGDGTDDEKASRKTLISAEEASKEFSKYAKGLSVPDGMVATYSEAIRAHYVGSQRRMNGEGDLSFSKDVRDDNKKLFKKSVEAVLGTPVQSGSTTVPIPYGMDSNTFIDRVQTQVDEMFNGKYKWGQYSLQVVPDGKYRVSIGGQQPFIVDPTSPPVNMLYMVQQENMTPEQRKSTWSFGKSGFGSKVYGGK